VVASKSLVCFKGNDSIRLVGVENWGAGPFPKKGNLSKALDGVSDNEFSILMSHDPTHWDHHVLKHIKKINLTLAGHTHGMQFGINFLGIKWSPVKYRYRRWMGLYKELDQYLYVNRGFGFLAWPGRVGMRPEITLIELEKGKIS
jgi:predicted MPP superfamily phosphohydrolase